MVNNTNWKGIDLNLLVAYAALYHSQSVSKAAQQLSVSQSAMSHSLARLRQLLNDPLFERQGHQMRPTERAIALAPTVDGILEQVRSELLVPATFCAHDFDGVCRIGLSDYAELIFAPVLFDAIRAEAPRCQVSFINVNASNYKAVADNERLDVIIGSINDSDPGFFADVLYHERHVCLYDGQQLRLSDPISLAEFCNTEHALVSPSGQLTTAVDQLLEQAGKSRQVAVASRNFLTIRHLIKDRPLLCIVPELMARMEMLKDEMTIAQPPVPVSDFDISLVWQKRYQHQEKNIWLRSLVSRELKGLRRTLQQQA